jgi:hypothetical protein
VRAALVENIDEPGRNPYQNQAFTNCSGVQFDDCDLTFTTVPAGKRLVLTNITGFIDTTGVFPNCNIQSHYADNNFGAVFFSGTAGTAYEGITRYFVNIPTVTCYGAGETPKLDCSSSDRFIAVDMALTGYYVSVP